MGTSVAAFYITLMPVLFAGVLNMVWCKLPWPSSLKKPMDGGKTWRDGRRIFGENKTWLGFGGMVLFGMTFMILWGLICADSEFLTAHNYFYRTHGNTLLFNAGVGVLAGLGYAVFELPNSFLKRRLGIEPGKRLRGRLSVLFVVLDQADSAFGVVLVLAVFHSMNLPEFLLYVLIGTVTHIVMNMLLYAVKLRKNPF